MTKRAERLASMIKDILQPLNTSGNPKEIKIGATYPHGVARQYTADMRKIVKELAGRIKSELMPVVREQFKQRQDGVRMDSIDNYKTERRVDRFYCLDMEDRFDDYEYDLINDSVRMDSSERMDGIADMLVALRLIKQGFKSGESLSTEYAQSAYQHNEKSINDAIEKQLGVLIQLPVSDVNAVNDWIAQNSELITDMQAEYLRRVQQSITNGFLTGKSTKQVTQEIQKATNITWRRANTIARNEIGNLNSQINTKRNEELGITEGIWRGQRDERERGNPNGLYPNAVPSHWDREGKRFKISEGINGERPGEPILCRCWTESVIPLD